MTHKGQRHHLLFIVLASNTTPIIGLASSERLNLIKRVYKVTESTIEEWFSSSKIPDDYPECFDEIRTLKSTYHMEIKDDVSPVVVPPRKVPFALKDQLKKELDHMERMTPFKIARLMPITDEKSNLHKVCLVQTCWKYRLCIGLHPLQKWWLPNLHKMFKLGNHHLCNGCKPLQSWYLQQVCTRQTLCQFSFSSSRILADSCRWLNLRSPYLWYSLWKTQVQTNAIWNPFG